MSTFPVAKSPSNQKTYATVTVTTSTDGLSDIVDLGGLDIAGYTMPAAWTAASMTFLGSYDSTSNMQSLYTSTGGELAHAVAASRVVGAEVVYRAVAEGLRYIQFRSGTAATPVAQAASRTIILGLYNGN